MIRFGSMLLAVALGLAVAAPARAEAPECARVALVSLVVTPERYAGRCVNVIGYARFDFELSALLVSAELARHGAFQNGIWLDLGGYRDPYARKIDEFDGQWIEIAGTFDPAVKGHLSGWPAGLRDVIAIHLRK